MLEAIDARRSVSSRHLAEPAPDDATLLRMLRSAVRVPDHGKRVPFRFIRIAGDARIALGDAVAARGLALRPDAGDGAVEKDRLRFTRAPLVVAVVAVFDDADPAIPAQERLLTAGSVCFALLQAAQAFGFGACWLTGWPAYDADVLRLLGLGVQERIAGFIHIGTPIQEPNERDRPDPAALLGDWSPPA
ncbi:nitroreductase [Luteimonas sp. MC1825]|uniref:nitroreductase family protein n=1 Tax=Luteimonas sp. MC1825 TaxID=2761107 RepID=UPI001615CF2A|nr:nitroreductase [Luteimonas sp. MC1825]MBB6599876.1 nitroreductase [Luteimonas sp. MC1825]QOC87590.1 nitroreductase [Luteimonas sp. MC1825]